MTSPDRAKHFVSREYANASPRGCARRGLSFADSGGRRRWSAVFALACAASACARDTTTLDTRVTQIEASLTGAEASPGADGLGSDGLGSDGLGSDGLGSEAVATEGAAPSAGADAGGSSVDPSVDALPSADPGSSNEQNASGIGEAASSADAGAPLASDAGASLACVPRANTGVADGEVNIDLTVEFQAIQGFGGINVPGWIADLTPEQVDSAFGNGPGQIGMSILRIRVPYSADDFALEVPSAARAVELGAKVIASPWTPPPEMKSSADIVGGSLNVESYGAYADHLLGFRDFMASNGVPLYAMSVQNEPDVTVTYESCTWTPAQFIAWLTDQGPRFGDTKLIAAESFNFNRTMTDPILQDPVASAQVGIIAGHLYGRPATDYPLARDLGKEVWMTEHYTDSSTPANAWPQALAVGKEINDSMTANYNAYLWWYIRRSYGPLTEDGLVSKRGYSMAQFSKFVRPGYVRVAATQPAAPDVSVTAYKGDGGRVVVVAVNMSADSRDITLDALGSCLDSFSRYTTSATKNVNDDGVVPLTDGHAPVTLEGQSVTTFVSR